MGTGAPIPDSVLDDVRGRARSPAVAWLRRATVAALAVVLAVGATGWLGVRSTTAHVSGAGYELALEYPLVARAGLDVPWELTVRRHGGFPGPVTVVVDSDYFDMFETQGWTPTPAAETRDGTRTYLTIDPPPGDTLTLAFDAYVEPSRQLGASGAVSITDRGVDVITLEFRTRLVP
ncbi:hypothetical protein [Rhodococcus gannanensis]|uniref:DUF2771 domain-containing protein n=1 Tax=Rhodococcus gannanensis TaxID=1960308 RepID=A0ABW4P6M0_9NOCA